MERNSEFLLKVVIFPECLWKRTESYPRIPPYAKHIIGVNEASNIGVNRGLNSRDLEFQKCLE